MDLDVEMLKVMCAVAVASGFGCGAYICFWLLSRKKRQVGHRTLLVLTFLFGASRAIFQLLLAYGIYTTGHNTDLFWQTASAMFAVVWGVYAVTQKHHIWETLAMSQQKELVRRDKADDTKSGFAMQSWLATQSLEEARQLRAQQEVLLQGK